MAIRVVIYTFTGGIMKHYFIFFIICLVIACSNQTPITTAPIAPFGSWKMVALSVDTKKGTRPITFDSVYTAQTFREILTFSFDSIEFFVRDSIDNYPYGLVFSTIYSIHGYEASSDTIKIIGEEDFSTIVTTAKMHGDTLIWKFAIDNQNPFSQRYGIGIMLRKYLSCSGAIPPEDWPSLHL